MGQPRTGAQLRYIPLNTPGFRGLNKQNQGALLGPEWATRLENTVIDESNRISARKGFVNQTTTTAASGRFEQLHEEQATGYLFGVGADLELYRSTDDGDTWTNVTNTATVTDANGQFHDFNGVVLYIQYGEIPVVYSGTNFADITDAAAPSGGISLVAAGRVWCVTSTGKSVDYSALLDHDDWSSSDTGRIDITSVWQQDDTITALAYFNGALVIFGNRNIVVYTDGQGSALGLDPLNVYVADTTNGIGCIARDSVVQVDGDLWFLSDAGLMSFGRLIQERSNPLNNLSRHIQDFLSGYVVNADLTRLRAAYSFKDRFYLLSMPKLDGSNLETGITFCFDTKAPAQDGSYRCAGVWNGLIPTAMVSRAGTGDFLMARYNDSGKVGKYANYLDSADTYQMEYESGWSDLDTPNIKIIKRLSCILYIGGTFDPVFKWAFDFNETFTSATTTYGGSGSAGEWGRAEWGLGEYNSGTLTVEGQVGGSKSGEHIKVGMSATINGNTLSIQQISLYAKQGRLR